MFLENLDRLIQQLLYFVCNHVNNNACLDNFVDNMIHIIAIIYK